MIHAMMPSTPHDRIHPSKPSTKIVVPLDGRAA